MTMMRKFVLLVLAGLSAGAGGGELPAFHPSAAAHYLFIMRVVADVTGSPAWRTGYRWRDQPTQKEADAVAGTGDRKTLGPRKWFERSHMTPPLSACAIVAFAGGARDRAAIAEVLRHYDYSTLNISKFFLAELAWYALPDPAGTDGKGTDK